MSVIIAACRTELKHVTLRVTHDTCPGGKREKPEWFIWHISPVYKDTNRHSAVFLESISAVKHNTREKLKIIFRTLKRTKNISSPHFNFTKLERSKQGLAVKSQV